MIGKNSDSVAIVGLGYVGLPLAVHIAERGTNVVGFDIDHGLIDSLRLSKSNIPDVPSSRLAPLLEKRVVTFTSSMQQLVECNVFVVCVPTPTKDDKSIDLSSLQSAAKILLEVASEGSLIVNESTSYPGTLRELFLNSFVAKHGSQKHSFATAPERIDPTNPTRIEDITRVVGGIDEKSTEVAVNFYRKYFKHVHRVSSPEIAEMSKLLENTFRQVNISLINEINDLCRKVGIDTLEVIEAASTKPYGFMKFTPSAGIGGHCIPVDPEYLQHFAKRYGNPLQLVDAATRINEAMGLRVTERIFKNLEGSNPQSGLLLGIAYKSNVPDSRDTPAEKIMKSLKNMGLDIDWHDPLIPNWMAMDSVNLDSKQWDFGVVLTAHDSLDIEMAKRSCRVIFDLTGKYNADQDIVQI